MARARTIKGRVAQVAAALHERFPTAYPVYIRWQAIIPMDENDADGLTPAEMERGCFGELAWHGREFEIRLSERKLRSMALAIEVLIHEWAHGVSTKHWSVEKDRRSPHDDEYALTYWRIWRWFYEERGWEDCNGY